MFANIASYPAGKILPNGENVHCTVEDTIGWMGLSRAFADEFPAIPYEVIVSKDLPQADRVAFGRPEKGRFSRCTLVFRGQIH